MRKTLSLTTLATAAVLAVAASAHAQQPAQASAAGSYRCQPQPSPCPWPTDMLSISQDGRSLDLKNHTGSFAAAKLTSDTTISAGPPWNADGLMMPDHSIQWSDGTVWRKQ